ncbi:hypothetical protein [Propionibacterium sp.]
MTCGATDHHVSHVIADALVHAREAQADDAAGGHVDHIHADHDGEH